MPDLFGGKQPRSYLSNGAQCRPGGPVHLVPAVLTAGQLPNKDDKAPAGATELQSVAFRAWTASNADPKTLALILLLQSNLPWSGWLGSRSFL